jgi:hypothetical protein
MLAVIEAVVPQQRFPKLTTADRKHPLRANA